MADSEQKVNKKRAAAEKKTVTRKKTVAKKKTTVKRKSTTDHRRTAADSRQALIVRLKDDLKGTKAALKAARTAAREEMKLVNKAAKDEIAVLKDKLNGAMQREKALIKLSEQKVKKMIVAGERWERQQLAKIRSAAAKFRSNRNT